MENKNDLYCAIFPISYQISTLFNTIFPILFISSLCDAWIIIAQMMKALLRSPRFFMARFKQTNKDVGLLGQEPDLQGKEYDKFRRFFSRVHL